MSNATGLAAELEEWSSRQLSIVDDHHFLKLAERVARLEAAAPKIAAHAARAALEWALGELALGRLTATAIHSKIAESIKP